MSDLTEHLAQLRTRLGEAERYLRIGDRRAEVARLEEDAARPDLWDDQDSARAITGALSRARDDVELYDGLVGRIEDAETLHLLGTEEDDAASLSEADALCEAVSREFDQLELRSLFSGDYDENDAICEVHSGEGGTDAQDWAEMLLRMYQRWAERRGFDVELDEVTPGTEAGISSATFIVKGRYAYGQLQAERGVHRLVRISPFNAQGKRQTAFSSLAVVPLIEDDDTGVEIDEKDLRIDTYRSSGAGGQHVNVTDSAVRITHLPTGVVVACQNERSQHQNKERAMQILRAKLADLQRQEREAALVAIAGEQQRVGFGSQIRSYVLQPYQLVKDLRTDLEVGNVDGVLDGDLDPFIEKWLRWRRAGTGA
ncbi:MAG TPA: peptide chain release factor 2 [Acidimicrobiales bacterium]